MPGQNTFEYAVIRIVPLVERQEFLNIGILLYCRARNFLKAKINHDLKRLASFSPGADRQLVRDQLESISAICSGSRETGEFAGWSLSERFNWLTSASSTIIQTSPVHSGLCDDPRIELERLYTLLVE